MGFCFVIQPFDDPNNARYEQVFCPAIEAAGLDPYRVDRDPAATILIDTIEERIRASDACLADITGENPNVWYELGFALAAGREVVLVCRSGRDRFPFDIQHRNIILYTAESPADFETLKAKIAEQLRAKLDRRARMETLASSAVAATQAGLDPQQLAALVVIAQTQYPGSGLSAYLIRDEMSKVGFTEIATTIAIRALKRMAFVEESWEEDERGERWLAYRATEAGLDWLEKNQEKLVLRAEKPGKVPPLPAIDELPF
jgi:hypothetical protein